MYCECQRHFALHDRFRFKANRYGGSEGYSCLEPTEKKQASLHLVDQSGVLVHVRNTLLMVDSQHGSAINLSRQSMCKLGINVGLCRPYTDYEASSCEP